MRRFLFESLKELKTPIKGFFYIIVGMLYFINLILDLIYNGFEFVISKLNKKIKKLFFFILIILFILSIITLFKTHNTKPIIVYQESDKMAKSAIEIENTSTLTQNICSYDEVSCKIKNYSENVGLDYKLAIAIARWETGNYSSVAFKTKNNVGGLFRNGSLMTFDSLENGIVAFVNLLKYNYIDKGFDTIEKISFKYAPIGQNDNGTNQYWVGGVSKMYNSL